MAVYFTLLKPGDTVLGMNLAHGGHLTHGHPLNFSGKLYTIVPYGVRKDDERIDYEELERLAHEHKPKMIMVGASAYPRVIDFERIGAVGTAIGAPVVTDMAHIAGLVAAGVHPSPVPHSDFVTTTTHKTLRGPRGGMVLCRAQYAKDLDRTVFPGIQGGPLMHIIAAKAVCFKEAMEPAFAEYQRQIVANAQAAGRGAVGGGLPAGQRRHRQPPDARRRVLEGHHRQGRPKRRSARRGSPSTRTRSRSTRIRRWSRAASASARPAITSRGMREAGDGPWSANSSRGRSRRPTTTRALARVKVEVEALCRKFPLYPEAYAGRVSRTPVEAVFAPGGPLSIALDGFEARAGAARDGAAVARRVRRRRRAARRGGHRHRQDARLPRPGDPSRRARPRLDRHQEPAGADLLQGPAGPARRARRAVHRRPT